MANTDNCFTTSNVVITAASGWLERLVRPIKVQYAGHSSALPNPGHMWLFVVRLVRYVFLMGTKMEVFDGELAIGRDHSIKVRIKIREMRKPLRV